MRSATSVVGAVALLTLGLSACSSGSTPGARPSSAVAVTQTGSSAGQAPTESVASSPSAGSTITPVAAPAVTAYQSAIAAARNAQRHPVDSTGTLATAADFTRFTFDPFRSQYQIYIWGLAAQGGQYRGTPPTSHITVTSVDLGAKPYPTVGLSDCPGDDSAWRLYNVSTGAVQPRATQKVSPPYRSSITMILDKKHWGLAKVVLDSSRTCTP